jgi:hypothetical protein
MAIPVRVFGREMTTAEEQSQLLGSTFHQVEKDRAVAVGADRDNATLVEIPDAEPTDLVELHLGDGSVAVTTYEKLREWIDESSGDRGDGPGFIPEVLPLGEGERGMGTVVLKVLRVFRVKPVEGIANLATREAIRVIEGQLGGQPGLYRLAAQGELGELISEPLPPEKKPLLIFLHGTASSTRGSFGGLFADTAEWRELRTEYRNRIFALEHLTLSESPAANALALARLLPEGAELHLVSHSRGGLIGEFLCRGGFDREQLKVFKRGRTGQQAGEELDTLTALGSELATKNFRVERFVRVACPAAGTVLASDRLDIYLSVLLNVLQRALPPGASSIAELLKAVLLEVARRRADPKELPGLEAQRPESPYIHFLNQSERVDHDLTAIAGDLKSGNLLQSLRALAGYSFFWQKNDLVVHTRAMYGGLPRANGGWVSYHEGPAVTHFSYFREKASRERLAAALLRESREARPEGFKPIGEELATRSFSFLRDASTRAQGTVLFLPDIFASKLEANGAAVWLNAEAIGKGDLGAIKVDPESKVKAGELVDPQALWPLGEALAGLRKVEAVPYDWRGGIKEAAAALQARLQNLTEEDRPVSIVAHGLGALGVLELLSQPPGDGAEPLQGARAILLAPPLDGSEAILRFSLADGPLFSMLKLLDQSRTESEVLRLFLRMQGLADLLPDRALDPDWWKALALTAPKVPLPGIAQHRTALKAVLGHPSLALLFGAAEETPALTFTDDGRRKAESRRDGDGWMINPARALPDRAWFTASVHERLPLDAAAVAAVVDLILSGATSRAGQQPPEAKARREPVPLLFPSQKDLVAELAAADAAPEAGRESVLRVRVAHGSLDRLSRMPVAVGHYTGDTIAGAEAFLDRCLEGRLRRHHRLGDYPGPAGTAAYIPAPGSRPPGALVIGLGDMGELTSGILSRGVQRAVIQRALFEIDHTGISAAKAPVSLPIAFLLIGTRGGGQMSIRQSMAAIVRGVLHARRALQQAELDRCVAIDEIFFIELWSDIAIAAGHALQKLPQDPSLGLLPGERIDPAPTLMTLEGGRGNSREYAGDWSWWRRIIVTDEERDDGLGGLKFVTLSERSRAEERLLSLHRSMVEDLLETAPRTVSSEVGEGAVVNTLFELLLPVPIKESIYDGTDLVLVVDPRSGCYPWELLAQRRGEEVEPLVSRIRLLRQFRSSDFREVIAPARTDYALVVGDPNLDGTGLAPLPAARQEADDVVKELERGGFSVRSSLGEGGNQILQKLFLYDYRILHIAAHGEYQPANPRLSGVVIGRNKDGSRSVLSAPIFKQLRAIPEVVFLNCCHLGRLGTAATVQNGLKSDMERTQLAASVANAIMGLGVRCLVVAGWAVNDRAAREFAQQFYRRLLAGETFGEAVHAGRLAVWRKHRHTTTWGAYQCYGDPSFRLRRPHGRSKGTAGLSFVSAGEVAEDLADIVAETTTVGASREYLKSLEEKLVAIERFLESQPSWKSDGEVLNRLAEAWKAYGDKDKAIVFYRQALAAWDAKAPLRAAEQIANLIDRQNGGAGDAATWTPLENAAGENKKQLDDAWLDWVRQLGETPERAALRGGKLKRRAKSATSEERQQLLSDAAKAYHDAVELQRRRTGSAPYYQALNAVALAWATGSEDRAALNELIKESRRSAEEERSREGERLWNVIADCEADLLEALLSGELNQKAEEIKATFKKKLATLGTPTEQDSAMAQVKFLLSCATGEREVFKNSLQIIAEAFSNPKE